MTAVRRAALVLALVALTAAIAQAQTGGLTYSSGGNMMSPAPAEQAQVVRPSFKQMLAQIVAKAQWRPSTVVARKAVKRNAR